MYFRRKFLKNQFNFFVRTRDLMCWYFHLSCERLDFNLCYRGSKNEKNKSGNGMRNFITLLRGVDIVKGYK